MSGFILLDLLALVVGYFWTKGRKILGLSVQGKHWMMAMAVFNIIMLLSYAVHTSGHGH